MFGGERLVVAAVAPTENSPPAELTAFLQKSVGLDTKQIAAIDSGQLVTKVVRTPIDRDVVVFGIVQVDVPRAFFVSHFKETDLPPRSAGRASFGIFGKPAQASDVGDLALSSDDVKDLRACKPRSCSFKLPASAMAFLDSRVTWDSPNTASEIAAGAREQMAAYVNDYRQHGNDAVVVYDDNASVKASDALVQLLADSPSPFPNVPQFQRYIENPFEPLDGVSRTVFWSRDKMARARPVVSIQELSSFSPGDTTAASMFSIKQLWADHYLEAHVDFITVVDRSSTHDPGAGVYVVMLRDYRFDNLPNNRLYSIRNHVANGLRDQTDAELKRVKQAYEESFRAAKVSN
jgi:hypothetical protein